MNIREIRILPPLAIGRLGSASEPVVNDTIDDNPDQPLEFRELKPEETLIVDERTGEISRSFIPNEITLKDVDEAGNPRIRPVAPFLEVFAITDDGKLLPLTSGLLTEVGVDPAAVEWNVSVGNRKAA